jgi:hypothetical protein
LIPVGSATREERSANRALIQSGLSNPITGETSGHSVSVKAQADSIRVSISCDKYSKEKDFEREVTFTVRLFEECKGEGASIRYRVYWEKVNPTSQPKHGEDQRANK